MRVARELKDNYEIKSISFQSNRDNLKFQRYASQNKGKGKINGKENIASLLQSSRIYQDKQAKAQETIQHNSNRLPLSSISNRRNSNSINYQQTPLKKNNIIKTKDKIEFYDELFNQSIKIKQFKEDEIPFTHSRILPKVQWMKIDNDIKTDNEQRSDATKMLHNWLGDTIKLIKDDDCYMSNNIDRKFLLLRNTNNISKRC